jgi:hypothetical protein
MSIVLFTRKNSIYKKLGHDCYDKERNAYNCPRYKPVLAHPPCRTWGNLAHFTKLTDEEIIEEQDLARFAISLVNKNGGIVEHPKMSKLWKTADISKGILLGIQQKDFGHRAYKDTYLYIVGCKIKDLPQIPLNLSYPEKSVNNMSTPERERTPVNLAKWLLQVMEIIENESL